MYFLALLFTIRDGSEMSSFHRRERRKQRLLFNRREGRKRSLRREFLQTAPCKLIFDFSAVNTITKLYLYKKRFYAQARYCIRKNKKQCY
jgi:hypothetical protein